VITSGYSNLGSAMLLSSQNTSMKVALEKAGDELSTGRKQDLIKATSGDLGKLFSIEATIGKLGTEANAIDLASGKATVTQLSLSEIHESLVEFGPQLLAAVERGDVQTSRLIAKDARQGMRAVVSAINVRYGRHGVFSGAAVDQQAISSADDVLADISTIIASSTDSTTALAAIDTYFFSPGGGFETNIFQGAAQNAPPFRSEDGTTIEYAQRADSHGVRSALRSLSIAAVAADAPNFLDTSHQTDLLREAGHAAIDATGMIIEMQESLGFSEGRIEQARAKNQAMAGLFELEKTSILAADPYESATRFQALEGQLQTIYTLTARLSGLSLTNFLR